MRLGLLGMINGTINENDGLKLFIGSPIKKEIDIKDLNTRSYNKVNINGDYYYVLKGTNYVEYYKQLDAVKDDDVYKWTTRILRNKIKCLHSEINIDRFTFNITYYYAERTVRISVSLKGIHKKIFDYFHVDDVENNSDVTRAINNWISEFRTEINNLTLITE